MAPPVKRRGQRSGTLLQKMELYVVVIGQDHIGKGEGNMASRGKLLLGRGKGHRAAGIDKEVDKEVHLFAEEFNIEAVAAGENSPIEIPDIVPRRVPPVIGELQTGPPAWRRVTARPAAEKFLARAYSETL